MVLRSEQDKGEVVKNRKIVAAVFVITGVISLGVWGYKNRGLKLQFGQAKVLSFDVAARKDRGSKDTGMETKKVEGMISDKISKLTGSYGVYVYRFGSGKGYGVNEDAVMTAVSFMKVPIMVTVFRNMEAGKIRLEDKFTVTAEDKRDGTGSVDTMAVGSAVSINELIDAMGKESDNTAAAILARVVGAEAVEKAVKDMGMEDSSFDRNQTTALDAAMMWVSIYKARVVGAASREAMEEHLQDSIFEDRIVAGLPQGVRVIHKVGTGDGIWSDGGVIIPAEPGKSPFVLVIISEGVGMDEAKTAVPEITKLVWDYEEGRADQ